MILTRIMTNGRQNYQPWNTYRKENPLGLILLLHVPIDDLKVGDLKPGDLVEAPVLPPNISQKRIVSSAPADTIVLPSGERLICNTLELWPLNSRIFDIVGYFQRQS